jgi:hypothetical protein
VGTRSTGIRLWLTHACFPPSSRWRRR